MKNDKKCILCKVEGCDIPDGNGCAHRQIGRLMKQDTELRLINADRIAALVKELDRVLELVEDNNAPWWMDEPDSGGFDVDAIRAALAKAKGGGS